MTFQHTVEANWICALSKEHRFVYLFIQKLFIYRFTHFKQLSLVRSHNGKASTLGQDLDSPSQISQILVGELDGLFSWCTKGQLFISMSSHYVFLHLCFIVFYGAYWCQVTMLVSVSTVQFYHVGGGCFSPRISPIQSIIEFQYLPRQHLYIFCPIWTTYYCENWKLNENQEALS